MKTLILGGAALAALAAFPASAQPADQFRADTEMTRSELQQRLEARFARADSDRDGFVTQEEVRAGTEARRAQRRERRAQRFEQLDSNNDGMISRAEFEAPRVARGGDRGERRAIRAERFAHRGGPRGGGIMMARFGARAFAAMDMNRDGRVALAETQRAALQRFDRVDSNRDGRITLDERQAARAARMERRDD